MFALNTTLIHVKSLGLKFKRFFSIVNVLASRNRLCVNYRFR